MHPVDGKITQEVFNPNQASGQTFPHTGRDYAATRGQTVRTIAGGTVIHAGSGPVPAWLANRFMLVPGSTAGGNYLFIQHDGWVEYFSHLNSHAVKTGQGVKRGQTVGGAGDSGNAQGVHLHYEVIVEPCPATYPWGRYHPGNQIAHEDKVAAAAAAKPKPVAHKLLTVTRHGAPVRTSPKVGNNIAKGYPDGLAKGAKVAAVGYVQGVDPFPKDGKQDDAWIKTAGGNYIWANSLGNSLAGLKKLN